MLMTNIQQVKRINSKVFIHKVCLSQNKGDRMLISAVCVWTRDPFPLLSSYDGMSQTQANASLMLLNTF